MDFEMKDVELAFIRKPVDMESGMVEILSLMDGKQVDAIAKNREFVRYMEHNHKELSEEVRGRVKKHLEQRQDQLPKDTDH